MDGQDRVESDFVSLPFGADDVSFRTPNLADLFAKTLSVTASVAAIGRVDLQKVAPASAATGAGQKQAINRLRGNGRRPFPFRPPREPSRYEQQHDSGKTNDFQDSYKLVVKMRQRDSVPNRQ